MKVPISPHRHLQPLSTFVLFALVDGLGIEPSGPETPGLQPGHAPYVSTHPNTL